MMNVSVVLGRFARILIVPALIALWITPAFAQDDNLDDVLGSPQTAQAGAADTASPQAGSTEASGSGQTPASEEEKPVSTNMLVWIIQAMTWLYTTAFLVLSITLVTLVVLTLIATRRENICPPDLVEGVEQHIAQGDAPQAAELIRADDSFLGMTVAAGLSRLDKGYPAALEAMQEVGEEETMKVEHNLGYISMIANVATMIGLLGTVHGMVNAFRTIALSGSTPKASALAMDISMALITTVAGLVIAIPAIMIYTFLRTRLQRLTLKAGIASESLLQHFVK